LLDSSVKILRKSKVHNIEIVHYDIIFSKTVLSSPDIKLIFAIEDFMINMTKSSC